jgi:hypothetical protein
MVAQIRSMAEHQLETAQAILAAEPEDFEVAVVRGRHVQHHVRDVKPTEPS